MRKKNGTGMKMDNFRSDGSGSDSLQDWVETKHPVS